MSDPLAGYDLAHILVLGAHGQLGMALQREFAQVGRVHALDRRGCDLGNLDELRSVIRELRPQVILNAAAYTAVDRAEVEPDLAARVNAEAPGVLAEEAKRLDALLVHYSTDYVFDGSKAKPWIEEDPTGPLNVYGATKLDGEQNILSVGGKAFIFRTSWVVSAEGGNFLRTMLRLGADRDELQIVDDQHGAPTSTAALATVTRQVLTTPAAIELAGVYHMTCAGQTTWAAFARAIFAASAAPCEQGWATVTDVPSSHYPTLATRPVNSLLSNDKLGTAFGVRLPHWQTEMEAILKQLDVARG